jgi:hypothetical protein
MGSCRVKPPPGVSGKEELPPTSRQWSRQMKPPPVAREEERCGGS